jgi:hypothetical protein
MQKQRLLGFLLPATQVSAYGMQSWVPIALPWKKTRTVGHYHAAGYPEVQGLSESARSKNMVAAPYPPAQQAISCLQAAGPRAIAARWRLPVAEGLWRERRVA